MQSAVIDHRRGGFTFTNTSVKLRSTTDNVAVLTHCNLTLVLHSGLC